MMIFLVLWIALLTQYDALRNNVDITDHFSAIPSYSTSGIGNLRIEDNSLAKCEFPTTCYDSTPVCGSDCQIYPDICYMKYIGCLQQKTLTDHPLPDCTDQHPLTLLPLPATVEVVRGQGVDLWCNLAPDSGTPHKVEWYEVQDRVTIKLRSGDLDVMVLSLNNVQTDRVFFCQISNCNGKRIVQSNLVKVRIPENLCVIYGAGHVHTFTQGYFSQKTACTFMTAMDTEYSKWFVYVRFEETWQIPLPSLSSATFYYMGVPVELQRGWVVNHRGTKVLVRQGETKEMFGIKLTFDGLYLILSTPEVTLHWDGLSSLIIGLNPGTRSLGLCGSNVVGEVLRGRNRGRRKREKQNAHTGQDRIASFVRSWSLATQYRRCKFSDEYSPNNTPDNPPSPPHDVLGMCGGMLGGFIEEEVRDIKTFYQDSCLAEHAEALYLIAGTTPTYCLSQLSVYHFRDKLNNKDTDRSNSSVECTLTVRQRQYLAYYAGCPGETLPFDVT